MMITTFLKSKQRLTDREISIYFMEGLDSKFRAKVQGQLKAEEPKHHADDPFTLAQILAAALLILSYDHSRGAKSGSQGPAIKQKISDLAPDFLKGNFNLSTLVSEIVKQLNSPPASSETQKTSSSANYRPRSGCCNFCSEPGHFMKSRTGQLDGCKTLSEYIRRGLCKGNENGFVILPSGDWINTLGKDIKERVDNWHKANNMTMPSVSTTFVGASTMNATSGFVWSKVDEDRITEREWEDLKLMETMVASTQKKIDATRQKMDSQNRGNGQAKTAARADKVPEKGSPSNKKAEPVKPTMEYQYKYVMPIEDLNLVQSIAKQALDVPVTMSTRELLSLFPDVRKHVKDLIFAKRVPQTATAAYVEGDPAEDPG